MRGATLALVWLVWVLPLYGEEIELAPVKVTFKRPTFLDSFTSVTVLEPEAENAPGRTVADLLATQPGIQVIRNGSAGQRQSVTIRGANSRQVVVLLEGFPAHDPQAGTADLSQIPLDAVETIEVYRGGKGALAGSGALGGAVVVRLKKGGDGYLSRRLTAGAYAPINLDSLQGSLAMRKRDLYAVYSFHQARGRFDYVDTNGATRTRRNNRTASDRLTLSWGRRLSSRVRLELMSNAGLTWRGSPGLEQFPSGDARERTDSLLAGARLKVARFPLKESNLNLAASYGLWHWRFVDPHTYLGPAADSSSLNQRGQLTATARHQFLDWLKGELAATLTAEKTGLERKRTARVEEDRYLGDAILSLRTGRRGQALQVDTTLRLAMDAFRGAIPVPGLEARYRFCSWLYAAASGGRSYRVPAFDELYFEARGIRGNPDLGPEDSWSVDLETGIDWRALSLTATLFYQWIDDGIMFLPISPHQMEARNTGRVVARGLEFAAATDFWLLSLAGSLSYLDAFFDDSGFRLPFKSSLLGSASARLRWSRLSVDVSGNWRSPFFLDRFESSREEGRLMVDAGLALDLGAGFRVAALGRNLLNKRDGVDAFQYPLPGLSWHVTLEHVSKGAQNVP